MHAMPHPSISPRTAECGKVSGAQPQLPLASGVGIAAIVEVLGVAVGVVPEVLRGARDGAAVAAEEAAHLGAGPEEDVPQRAAAVAPAERLGLVVAHLQPAREGRLPDDVLASISHHRGHPV